MKSPGKFGMAEAVVLFTMSSMSRIFLTFPRAVIELAGPAAWISGILGLAAAIVQIYVFYYILKLNPGKNLVEVTNDTLGTAMGTVFNIFYTLFFMSVASIFSRTFSEALIISALPYTPISVILTGYVTMGIIGAYVGLEALARSARVTYPFVLTGIAVLLLGIIPRWDFSQVFPILGNGPLGIVKGAVIAGVVTEILAAAIVVKSLHGSDLFLKITARAMLLGFGYVIVLLFVLLITFGWSNAQENTLPFYRLARLIYLGRFFQRVESIFIIIWGYIGMVKVALTIYASSYTLAVTFRLPDHRPLIWPLAIIIFTSSILPPDLPTAVNIESFIIRQIGWLPTFGLPLLVLAVYLIRNRGRAGENG